MVWGYGFGNSKKGEGWFGDMGLGMVRGMERGRVVWGIGLRMVRRKGGAGYGFGNGKGKGGVGVLVWEW